MHRYCQKLRVFVELGEALARLSTCKRVQVGAVVFSIDCRVVHGIGYNGPAAGLPNDSCTAVRGDCGCVHAEANALIKLQLSGTLTRPCLLYVTKRPCQQCAGLIVNSGIVRGVIYRDSSHDPRGLEMLDAAKPSILHVRQDGLQEDKVALCHWHRLAAHD
jgi:dCMP deaminase